MISDLDAFRSVNFDWTRQLKSVWRDPVYHVPSLHSGAVEEVIDYFARKTRDPDPFDEPLGQVIVGPAGYGKTHLVGELRRRIWDIDGWFVLLDFIGIKDFWSSVALGFLNSLQVRMPDGKTQYDRLISKIAKRLKIDQELTPLAEHHRGNPQQFMSELVLLFTRALAQEFPNETRQHRNVVTALILLISEDLDCHSVAHCWLQGMNLESEDVRPLGFIGENSAMNVVEGLSWVMSLVGPTLIAVDQIDAIMSASRSYSQAIDGDVRRELEEAQSIVDQLAEGLMDLHEKKRRAVTVVSCLEGSWKVLEDRASVAVTARYASPRNLRALPNHDIARGLIQARLAQTYNDIGYTPDYPTWPFMESAFDTAIGFSPRQLLKACEEHRRRCASDGSVTEFVSFDSDEPPIKRDKGQTDGLDKVYGQELASAKPANLMEVEGEEQLREVLDDSLRLLEKHFDLPDDIDVEVQRDPDQRRPSLHGRLSFTFHNKGDREQHYCFRVLEHTNARAFQSRLKAAMTASGIDTSLKFRHLFILRSEDTPSGPKTKALVDEFKNAGGAFIDPTEDDLKAFIALANLARRDLPGFDDWLRVRRPLYSASIFQKAGLCPPPFLIDPTPPPANKQSGESQVERETFSKNGGGRRDSANSNPPDINQTLKGNGSQQNSKSERLNGTVESSRTAPHKAVENERASIAIGRRYSRNELGESVSLAMELLPRHVAIFAGSGSGKTVLLRRIVEEAAVHAVPSIVLDINNDLSRLGDPWPEQPRTYDESDAAQAAAYHSIADVIIWTPGVNSGNPISLNLLPDFAAIGTGQDSQTKDERAQAVEMARATLLPYIPGGGQKAALKQGVLADALRNFALKGGGVLDDLISLLCDFPEDFSKIGDAPKLAAEIGNQLLAAIATNPLLQSTGTNLDPQQLFYGSDGKTRISVINFAGLTSDEAKQSFVNQLQMTLFTWIKQNPSPTGRLYVIDEAQNFAPSQVRTACKSSALSLVAQARKYGLGMVFATQLPKGIDNAIVSNSTTHFYGRMSSPATIQATQSLMAAKGGAADDIGRLTKGEFYYSTDGIERPFKIRTPLCLSWHPPNPPTSDDVIQKARLTLEKVLSR